MADAETILRSLLKQIAIEQRYDNEVIETRSVSAEIGNYTTKLFKVKITSPNRADLKLIAKVAVFGEEMREFAFNDFYDKEIEFYSKVARIYAWLQDKHNIQGHDRLILPKFYGCHPKYMEETVVMEDLEASGMKVWDNRGSIDWKYASKAVEELAKFHALSLAYGVEDAESSKKLLADFKYTPPVEIEQLKIYMSKTLEMTLEVIPEEYRDRFVKCVEKHGDMSVGSLCFEPIRKPILCHYDYKISNLMYKEASEGKLHLSILDFQTVHTGCGLADLFMLIFSGSDKQFRSRYFNRLVEHYYEQLCAALRRLEVEPDSVYTREDFDYEYKKMLPFGLVVAVFYLPIMVALQHGAVALYEAQNLGDMIIKPTPRYAKLLNDILDDYLEWGVL